MNPCFDDALKLDYLNGTLSDRERTVFEDHLAACPACRLEIAGLREAAAAIRALAPPPVPAAWVDAAKDRLRAEVSFPVFAVPSSAAPIRRWTHVIRYAVIAAAVIAGLALLFRLVLGGTVGRWLPGLSLAVLGISEPRAARTLGLVAWIVSLHALLLVPSIIDNLYLLTLSVGRKRPLGGRAAPPRPLGPAGVELLVRGSCRRAFPSLFVRNTLVTQVALRAAGGGSPFDLAKRERRPSR